MRKLQMPSVPCGRRWTDEGRAPQRRQGVEGRQEPLVSDHHPGQRRIAEVPDYGRGHPSGGKHARHEHRTVESMYYVLEGRGEVTSGRERKVLGPDTAIYFPAGSTQGIRNVGRG